MRPVIEDPLAILDELRRAADVSGKTHDPLLTDFAGVQGPIGIFGGSFDPLHTGHLIAARSLALHFGLDRCVLIPAHRNPLKSTAPCASDRERLEMLELALRTEPGLFVSPMELSLDAASEAPSYTVDTIARIRTEAGADVRPFLFVGSDLAAQLPHWKEVDRLRRLAVLVVYDRAGAESIAAQKSTTSLWEHLVSIPKVEISASEVRRALQTSGETPPGWLPAAVAIYIRDHGLYRQDKAHGCRSA